MKSSRKANHERMREHFTRGLELLVHFLIGLGFRDVGGFSPVASLLGVFVMPA